MVYSVLMYYFKHFLTKLSENQDFKYFTSICTKNDHFRPFSRSNQSDVTRSF